ncbi:MAG: cob(I)yrinic acid a,c-diamide adenosyltransferase [Arenicellales bacterium WSBS_2016_MAG_OTU3]
MTDQDAKHQKMAKKRNEGYQKKQAKATKEKGLLIVNTGTGKGKSSAAFGMALRGVGHGMKVGVVQFIKGAMDTAERTVMSKFDNVDFHATGDGFTWITQNREQDVATAEKAWAIAEDMINDPCYDMLVFDELNIILKYEYLNPERVIETLKNRREMLHIIVTGRHASDAMIEAADLVSDIRAIKHPYKEQGVKAQKGIEF